MSDVVNAFAHRLDIEYMLRNEPPVPDHVLPGLHAGTVGMLAGPGGAGKTMLELQIAVGLATGMSVLDGALSSWAPGEWEHRPDKVVFIAAEEPAHELWRRLHAVVHHFHASGNCPAPEEFLQLLRDNLHIHTPAGIASPVLMDSDGRRTERVDSLLRAAEGARLVILDPVRQLHAADENDSAMMNALVGIFSSVAQRSGAAVLVAHHTNRASSYLGMGDSAGAARGSTALTDAVRWQVNLSRMTREGAKALGIDLEDRGQYLLLDTAKMNYVANQPSLLLVRGCGGVLRPADAPSAGRCSREPAKRPRVAR